MQRPLSDEHAPYFQHYIDLVPVGDFFELFHQNTQQTIEFFEKINADKLNYRYAENKWTVKDILQHIIDTERVFAYRMLVAARGDSTTLLPGMDENLYAAHVDTTDRSVESILQEFAAVRVSTLMFLKSLTNTQTQAKGKGTTHPITARALGYIMIGHAVHHIKVIKERYLD